MFTTVTSSVPGWATSVAKTVAVSPSVLLNIVGRVLPLICTTELVEGPLGRNPLPVTVSVKFGLPAETGFGLMLEIVGAVCAVAQGCIAISAKSKTTTKLFGARRDWQFMEPRVVTMMGRLTTGRLRSPQFWK